MKKINKILINKDKNEINLDIRYSGNGKKMPVMIYSHGFKSFRNWGFIPLLCEDLAKNGYITINHDFSLNGIIDVEKLIFDNDNFHKNTVSQEVEDLLFLIYSVIHGEINNEIENNWDGQIYLAGHSLGGAVSIMAASHFNEVKKIALLASIATLDRNTERQKHFWKKEGYVKIKIAGTKQELTLDYNYLKDKEENFKDNAILKSAENLDIPALILHPAEDLVVKQKEAEALEQSFKNSQFHLLPHTGHTFSAKHPLKNRPETLDKIVELMTDFFRNA